MGNFTHQTDVTGKVTEYHYDLANNICEVWDNGKKIAEYEYNADNTIKYLKNGSLYTEYAYDADRNLIGLKTLLGTDTIVDNRYTYNGNGDRLEKYQKCGTTKYSYDKMRRLAKVEYPNATEELFYDKAGNRTKRLYNGTEELYQYDKRNRLTAYTKGSVTSQYEYDNAGNLLKDDKAQYTYDAFNRNTKVETFNGNIQINRYDAEGLRHEMEENGKLVTFIYRGDEVIAEESQEDKIRYIRTSVLLASDAESARTYYHYASDEMGSITHVTDSENEEILNHYEYDAWGNLTVCEEKVQNRFRFNGQQYDPISQQYYLRARYYNPVIGRFTQEDSYNVDGLNLYAYCRNNPVSYVDPSGNICKAAADAIIDKMKNNKATRNEQKKLAAYLRNKRNHGETFDDAEQQMADRLGVHTSPNFRTPRQLQEDIDRIHAAITLRNGNPNIIAQQMRTTTITQGFDDNGNVIHTLTGSEKGRRLTKAQIKAAQEIYEETLRVPELTEIPESDNENAHHGEQKGIRTTEGQLERMQASSSGAKHGGAACGPCAKEQKKHGVYNVTGVQEKYGGHGRNFPKQE